MSLRIKEEIIIKWKVPQEKNIATKLCLINLNKLVIICMGGFKIYLIKVKYNRHKIKQKVIHEICNVII